MSQPLEVSIVSSVPPSSSPPEEMVDVRPLKSIAQSMLQSGSPLRAVIFSLPDSLPRRDAISKIEVLLTLLYTELGGR